MREREMMDLHLEMMLDLDVDRHLKEMRAGFAAARERLGVTEIKPQRFSTVVYSGLEGQCVVWVGSGGAGGASCAPIAIGDKRQIAP